MNVLCVVAHPDDEVLGAGGALAKHAENGDHVQSWILCPRHLADEALNAALVLTGSTASAQFGELPDQAFDTVPFTRIVRYPELINFDPDVIYTHHPGDLNLDHALTARAVLTAFRPKPGEKPRTILACEVLSSTEWTFPQVFQPNWFVGLSYEHVKRKWTALECYPSEVEPSPHPRNPSGIMTSAEYRGKQNGVSYAEAFQLLRRGPC